MGLQAPVSADSQKPVAFINLYKQGGSGTIYTVPDGRYYIGYIYVNQSTSPTPAINGVDGSVNTTLNQGSTNGRPIEFYLGPGDYVVCNTNTSYYTFMNGREYNL